MTRRIIIPLGIAAAAAMVVLAVGLWPQRGSGGSVFAQALEQMRTQSYTFEIDVEHQEPQGASGALRGMVLEPGLLRLEQSGGMGKIVCIFDAGAGQNLILFERFKAALRFDQSEADQIGALGFLLMPERSIRNLWNLRAGEETALGQREVVGRQADGFRVVRTTNGYRQTISLWADSKTGEPLEVEVLGEPLEGRASPQKLVLQDFNLSPRLDEQLFSTDVPEGYTLAHRQSLEDLLAGKQAESSPTGEPSQADLVLKAMALVEKGQMQQAVGQLVKVDWAGKFSFAADQYLFTMTEKECISLKQEDHQKVIEKAMKQLAGLRNLGKAAVQKGRDLAAGGKPGEAEKHHRAALGLGRLLCRDSESMLIVRLCGIAMQQHALQGLIDLYQATGESDKLKEAQRRFDDLQRQHQQIRDSLTKP